MKKFPFVRILSFALALILVLGSLPATTMTVRAAEADTTTAVEHATTFNDLTNALGFTDFYGRASLAKLSNAETLLYAYDKIAVGIDSAETEILLNDGPATLTKADFDMAWEAYAGDFAHHFWSEYYTLRYEGTTVTAMIPEYNMTGTALTQARTAFETAANNILSGVKTSWSDFEKELYIHDTLAKNVRYAEGNYSHNAYGALVKGTAVCEGYAEALQYLLHKVGIQSYMVTGTADGYAHKWNLVRIGGSYYYVDLTWDDQDPTTYHAYFNITTAQIKEDHALATTFISLPTCTATTHNYFAQKGGLLTTPYNVSAIAALIQAGKGQAHVFIPGDAEAFGTWYANNMEAIAEALGYTGTYYYGFDGIGREVVLILTTLTIDTQPTHTGVTSGSTAYVTVFATGENLTYQWYYRNKDTIDFLPSSIKTYTYTAIMNSTRNGRQVYCVITDKYGNSVTTDIVTIYMINSAKSGTCGEGVTWSYNNGVLTISGNGYMDIGDVDPWSYHNHNITSVVITDGVKNLDVDALDNMHNLERVTIGKDVTKLSADAFEYCEQLSRIYISEENPVFAGDNHGVIYDKEKDALLYVPRNFTDDLELPAGLTTIEDYVLLERHIRSLTIPVSVTYIGVQGFSEWPGPVSDFLYEGTEAQWQQVYIAEGHASVDSKVSYLGDNVVIIQQPQDVTVDIGEMAVVTVIASGPGLTYKWNLCPIDKNPPSVALDETSNTVSIEMTPELSGSTVYCKVTNKHGHTVMTQRATIYMTDHAAKAAITTQPTDSIVKSGEIASATVVATGEGLTYQWYRQVSYNTFELDPDFTGPTYSLLVDDTTASRTVYCVITDKYGCSVQSNTVTLGRQSVVKITKQPVDLELWNGQSSSFRIEASGATSYHWYYATKDSDEFVYYSANTQGNFFSVTMDASKDGMRVYCVVKDKYGNSATSDIVTATMRKTGEYCGNDVKWKLDSKGTLTIYGSGPMYPMRAGNTNHYPWNRDKVKRVVIQEGVTTIGEDAFSATTKLTTVVIPTSVTCIDDDAFYYCTSLTDVYYLGSSEQWKQISIYDLTDYQNRFFKNAKIHYDCSTEPVEITTQPVSEKVKEGQNTSVRVAATGLDLTYTWYFKNKGASSFSVSTTATSDTYAIQMNSSRNGRQVYCVITDIYGNTVTSDTVTISMQQPLKITKQPTNASAAMGSKVTTSLTATGEGGKYTWYFKNKGASSYSKSSLTGNSYYVTMKESTTGRQVYCVVTDKYGNSVKSNVVTLTSKVAITKQPTNAAAPKGQKVTTKLTATGEGLTYKWYYKNAGASSYKKSTSTGSSYSVTTKSSMNGRQVYCVITDKYGNSVKSNVVKLYMGNPAKITKQPVNVSLPNGQKATTLLTATGDGLKYAWYFKNAGSSTWSKSSLTGNSYYVTMKATTNGRQVYCVVTDKYGISVKSNVVTLNMASSLVITKQPEDASAPIGSKVSVSVEATGDGLTYKWYICNPGSTTYGKSSLTGNEYYVTMKESISGRKVYCVITDKYGVSVTTNTVTLTAE